MALLSESIGELRCKISEADKTLRNLRDTISSQTNELVRLQKLGNCHPETLRTCENAIERAKESMIESKA
ncbi:MAG TPA: hypothetical protein VM260_23615, partial [Pirellula sp.]|nr:hypothetical protein [Pirellula sp.]